MVQVLPKDEIDSITTHLLECIPPLGVVPTEPITLNRYMHLLEFTSHYRDILLPEVNKVVHLFDLDKDNLCVLGLLEETHWRVYTAIAAWRRHYNVKLSKALHHSVFMAKTEKAYLSMFGLFSAFNADLAIRLPSYSVAYKREMATGLNKAYYADVCRYQYITHAGWLFLYLGSTLSSAAEVKSIMEKEVPLNVGSLNAPFVPESVNLDFFKHI